MPSSAASCSSRIRLSVARASASSSSPRAGDAVDHHLPGGPQQLGDLAHHDRRLLARPAQRRRRHHGRGDQGDAAADDRVAPPDQRLGGAGHERR